ncbi:hypothetical protein N7462_002800 [Penicillium macrosclerotiorum]|uniref:uncharacterized protein n=1 Tax=Penicillium macrosclerotiorum TaxID=303699 RepID=UPI002547B761|nr:uncharacterized protein N7462_002800 [Penicillium macrosclerotiorum]KAJ5693377.1 hypothetical protein N7462_002800 [Penicillium macrosclerotiorum]
MDPVTAISIAGNVLAFIDLSYKVISGVNEVLSTASGMTPENEHLGVLVQDLNLITRNLVTDAPARTENEKQLCALAANCHELSGELYQLLRRLRVGDSKSKWEGLRVKWQSLRKEKEIDSIERKLNGYQSQILLRLQVMFSQKANDQNSFINGQLEALRSEGQALQNITTTQLDGLYQTISTLVDRLQSTAAQDDSDRSEKEPLTKLSDSLFKFRSMTSTMSRENKILECLAFPSMFNREDRIENAESGTFAWIVDEKFQSTDEQNDSSAKPGENHEEQKAKVQYQTEKARQAVRRESTREQFLTWLNVGRHIFHISGKAGSGKSTMMKFLSHSSQVKKGLESWAGGRFLVFVRFFFWNSGDARQMSLEGLYRTLLFETCRQVPDLIPLLFPELWGSPAATAAPIRFDEVKAAFDRLIQEASSSERYFCFFIDGLDEFEGDEVDHWCLARDLQSWTERAENIKLCVSSRPHVPFVQSFANKLNHQVSIHDLTREDIYKFTAAMFEKDPNFHRIKDSYEDLVVEVVNISDGVFLWARLVVRSLLKGIGYQSSEKDLKRKLQTMPKGLDELFDRILGSIDQDDQLLSDQLFLLTTPNFCRWQPTARNAIAYSWLGDLDDPGFPYERPMQSYTMAEIDERLEQVSCTLDRLSRGLLELSRKRPREQDGHDYFTYEVQFLHRSARDYIVNTREAQMRARLPEFDVCSAIFRLLLAEFKFALPTKHDAKPRTWAVTSEGGPLRRALHILFTTMNAAKKHYQYDIPSRILDEAYHIVRHHSQATDSTQVLSGNSDSELKGYIFGSNLQRLGEEWLMRRASDHSPNFLCEVVSRNVQRWLSPDLMSHLRKQSLHSGPNLLLVASVYCEDLEFVQGLLHEGRSPREMVSMEPIRPLDKSDFEKITTMIPAPQATVSVWMIFLYSFVEGYILSGCTSLSNRCLEEFLQYEVDRDIMFVVRIPALSRKPKEAVDDVFPFGDTDEGSDERVAFDLLEVLELADPSNLEALRILLSNQASQEDRPEVKPISGPSITHQRGSLAKALDAIEAAGRKSPHFGFGPALRLESVICPSERLDMPFAFRIT